MNFILIILGLPHIIIDVIHRVCFLITLLFTVAVAFTEPIQLTDDSSLYLLKDSIKYIVDEDGTLSAQRAYKQRAAFKRLPHESIQIPRDGVMWLHFSVHNESSAPRWIIENAMKIELMELFVHEQGSWRATQRSGNQIPYSEREMNTRNPVFLLPLEHGENRDILIRLYDYQSASVRLELIEEEYFWEDYSRRTLLLGLAFGFFAALIIYNFIIYLFNRDRAYLFYSMYMTAFFLNQAAQERLFSQYITPNEPYGFFWFVLFGGATAALGLEFFRNFIETRRSMPKLDGGMRIMRWVMAALALSAFVYAGPLSADLLNIGSLIAMGLILWALVLRIIERDLLALVCLLGSLLYLAGTGAEIFVTLVPVPVTPFILNAQLYGALTQVLFLGFALGAKTYRLRTRYNRMQQQYRKDLEHSVAERTRELEEANRKLNEHAITDPLTGLYNRNELKRRMKELNPYLARKGGVGGDYVITVAYLDLDNFKFYNDTYGHGYGDRLLRKAADILRLNTRAYDLLFRLGGDEFLIIMPEADLDSAGQIVERIRGSFESLSADDIEVTISIGLASSGFLPGVVLEELIEIADSALLKSKESGKNRISLNQLS